MSTDVKNGPYAPATDECIEKWQVQVDYGGKIVVGPILRDELGGILARLAYVRGVLKRVLDEYAYYDPDRRVREVLSKELRAEAEKETLP